MIIGFTIDTKIKQGSHFAQIFFYSLCLRHILQPPFFKASDEAIIWLSPAAGFDSADPSTNDRKPLSLELASDSMQQLLFHKLPHILRLPPESVPWHYNPLCRSCPFDSQCRSRALQERKIGSMPNITTEQANILDKLLRSSHEQDPRASENVTEIEDLDQLIRNGPKLQSLEVSVPSTIRKAKRILGIPSGHRTKHPISSPIVNAAKTRKIQVRD
jgi:hypothetical protein